MREPISAPITSTEQPAPPAPPAETSIDDLKTSSLLAEDRTLIIDRDQGAEESAPANGMNQKQRVLLVGLYLLAILTPLIINRLPLRKLPIEERDVGVDCGAQRDARAHALCDTPQLLIDYKWLYIDLDRLLARLPPDLRADIEQSQQEWERFWPEACAPASPKCVQEQLKERRALLRGQQREAERLEVFTVVSYERRPSEDEQSGFTEHVIYSEQVVPMEGCALSSETLVFLNAALKPSRAERASVKSWRNSRYLRRTLIDDTSEVWGISVQSRERCDNCRSYGREWSTSRHWYWRDDLTPLRPEDLFEGDQWPLRVAMLIGREMISIAGVSDSDTYNANDYLKWVHDPSRWLFEQDHFSVPSERFNEDARVYLRGLEKAGVRIKRFPRRRPPPAPPAGAPRRRPS